jgi:hypothetical protein
LGSALSCCAFCVRLAAVLPTLEKFHTPRALWTRLIEGESATKLVTQQLPMEEERSHLHPDVQRLGLEKWLRTESGIVGDGNVVRHQAPGENREAQIAQGHLPPKSRGELRFKRRPECVGVDKQRYEKNSQQQEHDDGDENAYQRMFLHGEACAVY